MRAAGAVTGTGPLVRLAGRRDRLVLTGTVAALALVAAFSASATVDLYPTASSRAGAALALNRTPALVALYGKVFDPDSVGAIAMIKLGGFGSIFVALLMIALVVRHTRGDEEAGRQELLGAGRVGRGAPLGAALLVVLGASAALAALTSVGLVAAGLPAGGAVAFGLAWGGVGVAFGAVAGLTAQVATSGRAASGLAAAVVGVAYVLRAVGDASTTPVLRSLSWLSPIGWVQQVRPFAGERWGVLGLTLAFAVAVAAGALAVATRRDLGAGLVRPRPGPASAAHWLRSPLALAWRQHRVAFAAWLAGFALVGLLFGALASTVGDLLDSPDAEDLITRLGGVSGLSDAFLALELGFAGVVAAAYAVDVVLHLGAEKRAGRAEVLLATAVSRPRWAAGPVVVAAAGSTVLLLAAGLTAGSAHALQEGDVGQLARVLAAAAVQIPAAWVLLGLALALVGVVPRAAAGMAWAALAAFVVVGELGELLHVPQVLRDASPFGHVPRLPGGDASAVPVVALLAVAAALAVTGFVALRRRDVG